MVLAHQHAHALSCISLPITYVTEAPTSRIQWVRRQQQQGQLQFIYQEPVPGHRRMVWALLYPNRDMLQRLQRRPSPACLTAIYAAPYHQEATGDNQLSDDETS